MSLVPGTRLGSYVIGERIGSGGMGEVYDARDTRLDRAVAVKVLPGELATDDERRARFEREAKTVAALNHPGIVTIHAVEAIDGVHFIVMERIEGETLYARVPDGGLALDEFLAVAVPLAEGLAAAHDKGITHRDLKPANVMVTADGRIKILDFGLAKFLDKGSPSPSSELETAPQTREGTVMGTAPYMSPEQVEGKSADARSDVFSLGIMLYEMATGSRPFHGDSAVGLFSAILKDQPATIEGLPESVTSIIDRCLEKAPSARFESARALHAELAALKGGTREALARSEQEIPWVAVLPFKNRSADEAFENFGDDLAEDIITGLSRFPYYFVVAASSAFRFKGRVEDVRGVARELGARYVLEGSVRTSGKSVRVNVQLSDAVTGTGLWADTFDRDLSSKDVFELQDALTDRIVATVADINGVLAGSMGTLVRAKPVESLSAYESVLQYFAYMREVTPSAHRRTRAALERAVASEPNYASAWACLASVYVDEHRFGFNPGEESLERSLAAARRAVAIDPTISLAHLVLSWISYLRRDLAWFRTSAERTLASNPRDAAALCQVGVLTAYAGEWEKGLAMTRRARELNAQHPGWYYFGSFYDHYRKREYDQALVAAQKINMPGHFLYHAAVAAAAAQLGRSEEASAAVRELLEVFPDFEENGRSAYAVWHFPDELMDDLVDGFRKAGLEGLK